MIRALRLTFLFVLLFSLSIAAAEQVKYKITYVSAENYYVDCGTADGVKIGDQLLSKNESGVAYILEIAYAARHSASCKKIGGEANPSVDDILLLVITPAEVPADTITVSTPDSSVAPAQQARPATYSEPKAPTRVTGNVSLILHNWSDNHLSDYSYTQSTLRLDLGADHIAGRNLSFNLRSRGRHDNRQSRYYDSEWENRLWQLSFTYSDERERFQLSAGRFIPRQFARVGYIDGLLIEGRPDKRVSIGVYGGRQPEWGFQDIEMPVNRFGGYTRYRSERRTGLYFDQTLGFVGEYVDGNTSRTFFAISGNIRNASRWSLSHAVEIDFNTDWRETKSGDKLQLTSAYLRTTYRISKVLRIGAKYDNRQNYWTYRIRSMADSLFDDRVRRGVSGDMTVSPGYGYNFRGSVGHRKKTGDADPVISYTVSASKGRLFNRDIFLGLYHSGFDGPFEKGRNSTIRTSFDAGRFGRLSLSYGRYAYAVKDFGDDRLSQMFETAWRKQIMPRTHFRSTVQYNSGDDIDGWRFILETGYRF